MSQYVKVTRPEQCYPLICRDSHRKIYFKCTDDNWTGGDLPTRDNTYLFIESNPHPISSMVTLATIEDVESGQRYVIDISGLQMVGRSAELIDIESINPTRIDPDEGIIREEQQENSNKKNE